MAHEGHCGIVILVFFIMALPNTLTDPARAGVIIDSDQLHVQQFRVIYVHLIDIVSVFSEQ